MVHQKEAPKDIVYDLYTQYIGDLVFHVKFPNDTLIRLAN